MDSGLDKSIVSMLRFLIFYNSPVVYWNFFCASVATLSLKLSQVTSK